MSEAANIAAENNKTILSLLDTIDSNAQLLEQYRKTFDAVMQQRAELLDTITQLRRENERLKEALQFYALEDNWVRDQTNMIEYETGHIVFKECEAVIAIGNRAREALKDCEELK